MIALHDPGAMEETLRRLDSLQPDARRQWGRMEVEQMVCHLADTFRFALGERRAGGVVLPVPAFLARWIGIHTPLPWPKGAPTLPEFDQQKGSGTPPEELERDKKELRTLMERFLEQDGAWPRHPVLGFMNRREWGIWAYRHVDHHLRQFGV